MLVDQDRAVLEVLILAVLSRVSVLPCLSAAQPFRAVRFKEKFAWFRVFCICFDYLWFSLLVNAHVSILWFQKMALDI
jgi:hypothetical protein